MSTLRDDVSSILGMRIPKGGWQQTIDALNVQGRIDFKTMMRIVVLLAERMEEYEQKRDPTV